MKLKLLQLVGTLLTLVLFSIGMSGPAVASTVDDGLRPAKIKKHRTKPAKRQAEGAQFLYGSSETQKMRDKRLSRECKGAANGGACRGYTQ